MGTLRWLTVCLLLLPYLAMAQSVVDTATGVNTGGSTTTTTGSLTTSGSNRGLFACFTSEEATEEDRTVTGCTFNGSDAFDHVVTAGSPVSFSHLEIWYLDAPSAATGTVSCTHTGPAGSGIGLTALALADVAQAQPTVDNSAQCTSGCSTTLTLDLTTTEANSLMLTCGTSNDQAQTYTHGTGQNEESDFSTGTGAGAHRHTTSSEVRASAGTETLSSTVTGTVSQWRYAAMAIAASGAAPPTVRRRGVIQFR